MAWGDDSTSLTDQFRNRQKVNFKTRNPLLKMGQYANVNARFGVGPAGVRHVTGAAGRVMAGAASKIESHVLGRSTIGRAVMNRSRGFQGLRQAGADLLRQGVTRHLGFLGEIIDSEVAAGLGILERQINLGGPSNDDKENKSDGDLPLLRKDFNQYNEGVQERFQSLHDVITDKFGEGVEKSVSKYDQDVILPRMVALEKRLQDRMQTFATFDDRLTEVEQQIVEVESKTDRVLQRLSLNAQQSREAALEADDSSGLFSRFGLTRGGQSEQKGGFISGLMSFFGNVIKGFSGKMGTVGKLVVGALGSVLGGGIGIASIVGIIGAVVGNPVTWGVLLGAGAMALGPWLIDWIWKGIKSFVSGIVDTGMEVIKALIPGSKERHDKDKVRWGDLTASEKRKVARHGAARALPADHKAWITPPSSSGSSTSGRVTGATLRRRSRLGGGADSSGGYSAGDVSTGGPIKGLRGMRSGIAKELEDPRVRAMLEARAEIETGGQGPMAQKAWIEATINRAVSLGHSIEATIDNRDGYYPRKDDSRFRTETQSAMRGKYTKKYKNAVTEVLGGSNITEGATHNASAHVARSVRRGGNDADKSTIREIGGETFYGKTFKRERKLRSNISRAEAEQRKSIMPMDGGKLNILDSRISNYGSRDAQAKLARGEKLPDYEYIGVHYTGGNSLRSAINTAKNTNIGYQYLIDKDGSVHMVQDPKTGRSNHWGGDPNIHPKAKNINSLGVSFVGTGKATPEQQAAGLALLEKLSSQYQIRPENVLGHGEVTRNHRKSDEGYGLLVPFREKHGVRNPDIANRDARREWAIRYRPNIKEKDQIALERAEAEAKAAETKKPELVTAPKSVTTPPADIKPADPYKELREQQERALKQWEHRQAVEGKGAKERGKHIPTMGPQPSLAVPAAEPVPKPTMDANKITPDHPAAAAVERERAASPPPSAPAAQPSSEKPSEEKPKNGFDDKDSPTTDIRSPRAYAPEAAPEDYGSVGFGSPETGGGGKCFI